MTDKSLIENCMKHVPDGFKLVVWSAHRAQKLSAGIVPCVPRQNNKDPVVALREIAEGRLDLGNLQEEIVTSMQQFAFLSEGQDQSAPASPPDLGATY